MKSDHGEKRQDHSEKQEQPPGRRKLFQNAPNESPYYLERMLPGLLAPSLALTDVLFVQPGAFLSLGLELRPEFLDFQSRRKAAPAIF
jgi:hypothetical protein